MVLFAEPTAPSVFPLRPCCGSLTSTTQVNVGCLVDGYLPQPVKVQWNSGSITSGIKNFPAVLNGESGLFTSSSLLTISTSDWESKTFECNVEHPPTSKKINKEITVCSTQTLQTSKPDVQVLQSSCAKGQEKGSIDLVCLISGYAPEDINVQWLLNGQVTSISPSNSTPYKNNDGTFMSKSAVSVPAVDWNAGDSYTCRVTHSATSTRPEDSIKKCQESCGSAHPKIELLPPSPKDLLVIKEAKVKCVVSRLESADSLVFTWSRSDTRRIVAYLSDPEKQYDGTYTVISTLKISPQDWNKEVTFKCTVKHDDLLTPVEKSIHKTTEPETKPTIYMFHPPQEELKMNDFVTVTCLLKGFSPKNIYVQWKKNNAVQSDDYYINTEPIEDEDQTFIMYSMLTIAKTDWNRGATISCIGVQNEFTEREISKSSDYIVFDCNSEEDEDSLWTTAATFITLFLLSFFYSATITLVKVKWFISRILQFELEEGNHFITVLDSTAQ